jgi:hypothetical protein
MKTQLNKRHLIAGVASLVLGLAGTTATAGTITGSPHDFSTYGWSGGRICIACHTPHNGDTSVTAAPLWNHQVTTSTFTMYTRDTIDGTITGQPEGVSRLCLSCHDGTVGVDAFGGASGTIFLSGSVNLGTDLSNDHPISLTYNTTTAATDGALHNPATTTVTIGAGGDKTRTGTIDEVMLSAGTVQCSSCHDVHNSFTVPGAVGQPLLKVSKAASALCLTCHNK